MESKIYSYKLNALEQKPNEQNLNEKNITHTDMLFIQFHTNIIIL